MNQALLTAAAGLRSRLETLELVGNNIANVDTAGFKAGREFYNLFLGAGAEPGLSGDANWMPVIEGSAIDFRQGALTPTAAALDLALDGPGFFAVEGPQGPLYTRNGNFRRSTSGQLETAEGYAVLGQNGRPVQLPPGNVTISPDGAISAGQQGIGRLQVVDFPNPQSLARAGGNYFRSADSAPPLPALRTRIAQGQLEGANVNPAEAAIRLVEVSRQFETLSRAVSLIANEMDRQAIEQIPAAGA
ncbi:MAG TPA: flagellar basal-body rod protein FlgF [Bryobacterales bacterium]|jgi:flagellar basal-body rod protein FlgF|nr:flagellar basal-body rod protein FlgF [Bryobacterales bacterium]